jgi:hypothetical protein
VNHKPAEPDALPACTVCSKPEGIILQEPDRALCLSCALGSAQIESKRPDPAAPGGLRLALAGDLLDLAVPLWILKLQQLDDEAFELTWRRWLDEAEPSGVFSEVLPAGGAPGLAAQAFNALARSLAALAFVPGGVPFAGRRWEAQRSRRS